MVDLDFARRNDAENKRYKDILEQRLLERSDMLYEKQNPQFQTVRPDLERVLVNQLSM